MHEAAEQSAAGGNDLWSIVAEGKRGAFMNNRKITLIAVLGGAVLPVLAHADAVAAPYGHDVRCQVSQANLAHHGTPARQAAAGLTGKKCVTGNSLRERGVSGVPQRRDAMDRKPVRVASAGQGADPAGADGKSSGATIQEVVVTAQKYRQTAFSVPISLVVLTAHDLDRNNIRSLNDLQFYVPGLAVANNSAQRHIVIDGVSNFFGSGSLVGQYIDEADATPDGFVGNYGYGQLDARTYDMARVEVIRGPQGTLYGEGSMGGTIHFVTNKPVLDKSEVSSDVAAELTQDGAPSQRIDMMINAPLVENAFGLRFAGEFEHQGGWIDEPGADAKNVNQQNLVNARIEALWRPTEKFGVNLMQIEQRNDYGLDNGEDASGNYTQYFNQTTIPQGKQGYHLSNGTLTYAFSGAQLVSSTTFVKNANDNTNWGELLPIRGVNFGVYFPRFQTSYDSLSEEVRLSRTGGDAWQWTVGYFYKRFSDSYFQVYYFGKAVPPGTPLSAIPVFGTGVSDRDKSSAGFADTSYRLLRRLTVGLGARYYTDNVQYGTTGFGATSTLQTGTFSSTDPRVYIRYLVTRGINVYASAAKGFRAGGFNSEGQAPYEPENVWTYDFGTKMRMLDGRMSIDTDAYLSNYTNYDIVGITASNPVNITRNGGTARIKGVNGDVVWRPRESWSVSVSGDYVDAKFVTISALDTSYEVGDPVPAVPEYLVAGSLERDFHWLEKPAFARLEYSQLGPSIFFNRNLQQFGFAPVLHLLNLNTGVQWNESLRVSVYAQNLTNDRGYVDALAIQNLAARQRPRTVGISFAVEFD